ncbi:MAG: ATP-binding protein [Thermodesulfobacteriota bacterium]|nr:ATP-binding protein [Thermodesulfobacteriota bacterium]
METKGNHRNQNQEMVILKNAVENTNEAFVTIDENHKVLFFNKAAEKIFGFSRKEVIGNDLDIIMSPSCSQGHRQAVTQYVKTRKPGRIGHETEMLATRRNGDTFPAAISFSVTEVNGKLFFTGIVRDMTEKRALMEQVIRSERMTALGQLVAEVTHEIKNPLMVIGGFAQQLVRVIDDKKILEKLNIITDEVKRLEKLLSDIREFHLSKTIASEKVDIKELLQEIYSMLKEDCERQNIRIRLNIDAKAMLVTGDRNRLKQVFLNLVKNSMESMEKGGILSIETILSGDHAEITVTDEGCGITEQDKEKIFSPFFTTKSHGTGLGLCISKRIIEEHTDSSFTMKSKEGKGTSFKISLPIYKRLR